MLRSDAAHRLTFDCSNIRLRPRRVRDRRGQAARCGDLMRIACERGQRFVMDTNVDIMTSRSVQTRRATRSKKENASRRELTYRWGTNVHLERVLVACANSNDAAPDRHARANE